MSTINTARPADRRTEGSLHRDGYVPVFTTHNYHIEGGNKTHIALVEATGVGKVETVVLCGRSLWLPGRGTRIDDITQWLSLGEREVCKICARKAKAHNAELSDPAHETQRLQTRTPCRVR